MNNDNISSNWKSFNRIWVFVAIVLFILLLLLWLLGFGPWRANCEVSPTIVEKSVEVEKIVDSPKLLSRISILEIENAKIAGLMVTIDKLKKENGQIATLTTQVKTLEAGDAHKMLTSENAKITGFQNRIKELESDAANVTVLQGKVKDLDSANAKALSLQSKIDKLEAQNQVIPNLQAEITALQNAKPKVVEKIVERIVTVSAPQKVMSASVSQAATVDTTLSVAIPIAKLYFDRGSSQFPADNKLSLSDIISYLHQNVSAKAVLSGFHDSSGNLVNNQKLSLARARTVSRLLQDAGISSARIVIAKPAQTEGTGSPEEARRVEVKIAN